MRTKIMAAAGLVSAITLLEACSDPFEPYNELDGFRVLAVRADQPTLLPGATAKLDALVHTGEGETVEWAWSWCPITGGTSNGYQCAISEEELQKSIDQYAGAGVITIPPYALSSTATASFAYDLPPSLFEGICAAVKQADIPAFVERPACDGVFDITIRLVARSAGKEIVAVKELGLVYGETASINQNPSIVDVISAPADQPDLDVHLPGAETSSTSTAPPGLVTLARDKEYILQVLVPDSASERYTETTASGPIENREVLLFTWFTEGGKMEFGRTSFIDGEIPLVNAAMNSFRTPRAVDYPYPRLRLAFVVLDGRGGVAWTERTVALEE